KPVRLSERCGVSSAENNSGCGSSGSNALLPSAMGCHYTPIMAKIIRKAKPRARPSKPAARTAVKAARSKPAKKAFRPKPWAAAEVYEAFSRFRKANPEPRGELEHLNPYTLLVAVVLSAQATDAGVNRAT